MLVLQHRSVDRTILFASSSGPAGFVVMAPSPAVAQEAIVVSSQHHLTSPPHQRHASFSSYAHAPVADRAAPAAVFAPDLGICAMLFCGL